MANKISFIIQFKNKFGKTADVLNRKLAQIERGATKADVRMRKFEKRIENTRKTAGRFAKTGAVITAGVTAPIIFMGKAMVDAASDATETANKFNAVFDDVKSKANKVADTFAKEFGVANSTAREMIGNTGDLMVGFGFTGEAALAMSDKVARLASDLTSFQNFAGGAAGANVALTKALLGESEAAKALGIVVRQGTPEFKKNIKMIMRTQRVTLLQAKAIEILRISLSQSRKAVGDVSRTWEDYQSVVRRSAEQSKEMKESFGRLLIPAATKLMNVITSVVQWMNRLSPASKKTILAIAGIAAVVGPLILLFGGLAFALTSIVAAAPLIATGLGLIAAGFGLISFPVIAVIAGITAIGAVLFSVWKNWDSIVANMRSTIIALLTPLSKVSSFLGFGDLGITSTTAPSAPVSGGNGTINGNILVSAEGGAKVKSTSMQSQSSGLNLGMNMAAAGA